MAVSDRSGRWIDSRSLATRGPSRYDMHLVAIPVVFLGALLLELFGQVTIQPAMFVASLIEVVILADAIVLNPPNVGRTE